MSKLKFITSAAALSVVAFLTASPASAAVILFQDDFNRGASLGGGYYGQDTLGNGWTEVEDDPTGDVAIRGTVSDNSGNYVRLRDNISGGPPDAGVAQLAGISTAGHNNITLSYDLAPHSVETNCCGIDTITVEWKLTTDMSWTLVQTHTATANSSAFFTTVDALGAGAANITNLQFRFWTDVSTSSDEWRLDNVVLMGDLIPRSTVPEPGTLSLLGLGLLGAGIARRRKKA